MSDSFATKNFSVFAVARPNPALGKHGRSGETAQQTLIREALEYQDLYHKDFSTAPGACSRFINTWLEHLEFCVCAGCWDLVPQGLWHRVRACRAIIYKRAHSV